MSDFNNLFGTYEKSNNYFFTDDQEDIFSSYLNSEDTVKQNNSSLFYSSNINNDNINNNIKSEYNYDKNSTFSNLFKIPENTKVSFDNEKSIFKSFNSSSPNINTNIGSGSNNIFTSKLFNFIPSTTNNEVQPIKTELIQNKRERGDSQTLPTKGLSKFKTNSKSCSSLSEKDSGFLLFKTTKVDKDKKNNEYSDEGSDEDQFTENNNDLDPISIKLKKNRMAAKKSRQKRKIYIQNLEEKVKYLEHELENQKKLNEKQNRLEDLIELVLIKFILKLR